MTAGPPPPLWPPAVCRAMKRCPECGWDPEKQGHHQACPNNPDTEV